MSGWGRVTGKPPASAVRHDREAAQERAAEAARILGGGSALAEALLRDWQCEAERVVARSWSAIEAVAAKPMDATELSAAEVDAIA
jgi:hypothetical protein